MRINDILEGYCVLEPQERRVLSLCSDFLTESNRQPLLKNLQSTYGNFSKVKVRFRRGNTSTPQKFTRTIEQALDVRKLWARAVFAYGEKTFIKESNENIEQYYIFPINGFKYIYSKEVINSGTIYQNALNTLIEQFDRMGGEQKAIDIVKDLVKYTYVNEDLGEGISAGAEVLIYNISHYYAVNTKLIEYKKLLSLL